MGYSDFLSTLGWRWPRKNNHFASIQSCSVFHFEIQLFEFPNFNLVAVLAEKKVSYYGFPHFKHRRRFYAYKLTSEEKALPLQKWISDVLADFQLPCWCTKVVHQYGVSIYSHTNMASPYKSMGVLQSSRISFLQVVFSTLKLSNARQIKIADRTFS